MDTSVFVSFFSGILAAFTPCAAVLIPMAAYKFLRNDNEPYKKFIDYVLFVVGFIFVFLISAKFLSALINSSVRNGFQLGLGFLFIVLGVLEIMDKLNPLNVPVINNPFLFGSLFAILMSFNPCTLPYMGVIIGMSNPYMLYFNLISFAFGLIMPSVLFAFFGSELVFGLTKKMGKRLNQLTKLMSVILIVSGIYLVITIKSFGVYDNYLASFMVLIIFWILLKALYIVNSFESFKKWENILLIITLLLIVISLIYHCNGVSHSVQENTQMMCGINTHCEVCTRCAYLFSGAVLLGIIAIVASYYNRNKSGT